jgi:hypothetical protein
MLMKRYRCMKIPRGRRDVAPPGRAVLLARVGSRCPADGPAFAEVEDGHRDCSPFSATAPRRAIPTFSPAEA